MLLSQFVLQVPLSVGFPRHKYWSRLPFPSPGDLCNPGIEPELPAVASGFFPAKPPGKPPIRPHRFNNVGYV